MSDLDEDLLALAGDVGDDDVESKPTKKRTAIKRQSSTVKKRRKNKSEDLDGPDSFGSDAEAADDSGGDPVDSADGGEENEESEDEVTNPYPLMGKYKNEEDMATLEAMNEIDREQILFDRSQEMQRFNEQSYLAERLKKSRRLDKTKSTTRTSTRDAGKEGAKRSQLTELKKKREEKTVRAKQKSDGTNYIYPRLRYDDDDDENENEDEVEAEADDEVVWSETPVQKELDVGDLNKIRLGKTNLAKYCHYPEFETVAQDCFVRVNIGYNRHRDANVYRICQIKSVIETKVYTFNNRTVNASLLVTHGSNEKIFEMGICSDHPFTEEEFATWRKTVLADKLSLPSRRLIDTKFQQLQKMRERSLTVEEVNVMIDLRQKLTSDAASNSVMRKTMLNEKRIAALSNGDIEEVADIDAQIASIDQRRTIKMSAAMESPLQMLAKVNERNRRANQDDIRKAEMKSTEERRKAKFANKGSVTSDPFSRLKTSARMYYDSTEESPGAALTVDLPEEVKDASLEEKKLLPGTVGKQSMSLMDDVIAKTEFGIDIELDL
ncbi:hypothetical protein V1512DRAFT_252726 [Lipomyces arxii]|uniref:uncharacterized protein n=1 Tax=Lipomyces arxii TaxID=56418 RepID=UPI0034CF7CA6